MAACATFVGEPLWESQEVRPLVNADLAAPLSLYAAPLTNGLPAQPSHCPSQLTKRICTRADTRFLPEVERSLVSRLAFPPNLVPRHSHFRPRPSRAIS
jgi:hypothetical protein